MLYMIFFSTILHGYSVLANLSNECRVHSMFFFLSYVYINEWSEYGHEDDKKLNTSYFYCFFHNEKWIKRKYAIELILCVFLKVVPVFVNRWLIWAKEVSWCTFWFSSVSTIHVRLSGIQMWGDDKVFSKISLTSFLLKWKISHSWGYSFAVKLCSHFMWCRYSNWKLTL